LPAGCTPLNRRGKAAYFAELKNAPYKRWVELGEGTHFMMLEKNRMQFIHEVEMFLEESPQAVN